MRAFRDISIQHKLTLLLMGVVSVVLLAVSIANVVGEVSTTRRSMTQKYSSLAKIVAGQAGAALSIADVDSSGAQEIIDGLAVAEAIQFAALDDLEGREVVSFAGNESARNAGWKRGPPGARFVEDGMLEVVEPIALSNGSPVGRLSLHVSTAELDAQIRRVVTIAVIVYGVALCVALLLSIALQRIVSRPVLDLASLMTRVSTEHDYSIVSKPRGADELGALSTGFNAMLAEIRRRDDELARSNEYLLRSNDELRQFAYVASHDLQEPLLSVSSFCDVLKEDCYGQLSPEADQTIDRIVAAAGRMRALVTGLLGYSRLDRDDQNAFEPIDVDDVMTKVMANLHGSIEAAAAVVEWGDLPEVVGDRLQLGQLLQNLVGNAILYRSATRPKVTISARREGRGWLFSVADNGIGISPEHHGKIFEIFKRLHNRQKYPGTGIGLALCRKIVERHGGRIWVESKEGEGSVFKFTIPSRGVESKNHECERELAAAL